MTLGLINTHTYLHGGMVNNCVRGGSPQAVLRVRPDARRDHHGA
jgi:hypothetical protein